MFIVFEGLDGAGKSTQVQRASDWLTESGQTVVTCRDPGSTGLGEKVRDLVLRKSALAIDPHSEMLLFMVARCQLTREVIQPALREHRWVLCDRFQMSTVVYQGHAGRVDLESIRRAGQIATGGLTPDHVFVLDLDPDVAMARLGRDLDRMEARGRDYFSAVREGFRREVQSAGDAATLIDASRSADQIAVQIEATLRSRFAGQLTQAR